MKPSCWKAASVQHIVEVETIYIEVAIAKSLIQDVEDVEVKLNDEEVDYTAISLDDSWLIYLTYPHSTLNVTMRMSYDELPDHAKRQHKGYSWATFKDYAEYHRTVLSLENAVMSERSL